MFGKVRRREANWLPITFANKVHRKRANQKIFRNTVSATKAFFATVYFIGPFLHSNYPYPSSSSLCLFLRRKAKRCSERSG